MVMISFSPLRFLFSATCCSPRCPCYLRASQGPTSGLSYLTGSIPDPHYSSYSPRPPQGNRCQPLITS